MSSPIALLYLCIFLDVYSVDNKFVPIVCEIYDKVQKVNIIKKY